MRNLSIHNQQSTLPQMGLLTQVTELSRYDMIYALQRIKKNTELRLEKDTDRPWEKCAWVVYFQEFKLGYISQKSSAIVQRLKNKGNYLKVVVKSCSKSHTSLLSDLDIQIDVY